MCVHVVSVCVCVCVVVMSYFEVARLQGGKELSWREVESLQGVTALGLMEVLTRH